MADNVKRVSYFYTIVPNEPGQGARVLGAIKDAGVNLSAFHAFPAEGGAQLDLVAEDSEALKTAAQDAGIQLTGPKTAFIVEGDDRPGACADILSKLGDAGINVIAMDAVAAGGGRYGSLFWVDPGDVDRVEGVLG